VEPRERVEQAYDELARRYDRAMGWSERIFFRGGRAWVARRVTGRILEIGVGTGLNLPLYPPDVRITGIDLSAEMLALARRRAQASGRTIALVHGDAEHLPFSDETFDTVVSTFSLCTIPDARAALAEAGRVLRRGGRLVLLEHVRSPKAVVRRGQRALEPLFLKACCDHLLRDPLDWSAEIGFELVEVQRLKWGIVERAVLHRP
jgi:ubiquinone/menaquinone biosynthesis C-methylase UbiE